MKFLITFSFLTLFLTWCFWIGEEAQVEEDVNAGLIQQEIQGIDISTPSAWKIVPVSTLPVPKSGEIVFASSSTEQRQWYLNNIVILKSPNALSESSKSLMKNNVNFLNMSLESFNLKSEKEIIFNDEENWLLLTFEGKYNSETPQITYLQTARSCGDNAYYITLSLAEQLPDYDRYADILKTFACKK